MTTAITTVNGSASAEPRFDPVALAEAEAVRTAAAAKADALRIEAEGKADAEKTKAIEDAERIRLENQRKRMRLEKDEAAHAEYLAKKAAETAKADAEKAKAEKAAEEEAEREAQQLAEQERSEQYWKWGARGIYAVGLIIAAPVQFIHFWDPKRPFLVAAPGLIEGFALVLAFGATWAVAHRRDVAPYRIGIMISAVLAAVINLHGGISDPEKIGFNAGLIGAIASLGGPIVLMAYEHGIAQKADGIPSFRERHAAEKERKAADAAKATAKVEREAAAKTAAEEKAKKEAAAQVEQQRKDKDRQERHAEIWDLADSLRAARGEAVVTDTIFGDAWHLITGSRKVGITPEIEAAAKAAQARMKVAGEMPIEGEFSLITSQKGGRPKKDPDAPDGRRFNGGTPPRRVPGVSRPNSPIARKQARLEQTPGTPQQDR